MSLGGDDGKMNVRLKETIRILRKKSTEAECLFWNAVRARNLKGYKFLRQHPIKCQTIDGPVHDRQRDYDEMRTQVINQKGLRVIRFKNEEIQEGIEKVINRLIAVLET